MTEYVVLEVLKREQGEMEMMMCGRVEAETPEEAMQKMAGVIQSLDEGKEGIYTVLEAEKWEKKLAKGDAEPLR